MFQTNSKITPAQIVEQLAGLVDAINDMTGVDKGEFDDPRQIAFDELVGAACLLKDQIYRRAHLCTDAEMAYALWWDHYECDRERLEADAEAGEGIALMIARHLPRAAQRVGGATDPRRIG